MKYSRPPARVASAESSTELLTVKVRFKEPASDDSRKLEFTLTDRGATWAVAGAADDPGGWRGEFVELARAADGMR